MREGRPQCLFGVLILIVVTVQCVGALLQIRFIPAGSIAGDTHMLEVDTLAITALILGPLAQSGSSVVVLVLIETLTITLVINAQLNTRTESSPIVEYFTLGPVITWSEAAVELLILEISLQSVLATDTVLVLIYTNVTTQIVGPPLTAVHGCHQAGAGQG